MADKKIIKPPKQLQKSIQYDLFSNFFGDSVELSNTIELWDAIPKYAVSSRKQIKLRNSEGRLPVYDQHFVYAARYNGRRVEKRCRVEVHPTAIKTNKGYIDFYPSADEALVEEVIRKIFTDQQYGMHDPANNVSWVRFSLQMIRKELKIRGKTRNLEEIKRSIDILSRSIICLYQDNEDSPIYTNPILGDVTRISRQDYLTDSSLTWAARLPVLISKSINELSYRQFNYGVLMELNTQLARWLHKRLSHHYINASIIQSYNILFSSIQRDSGLLNYARMNENTKVLESAFKELTTHNILSQWKREEERKDGRKFIDIKYGLYAHIDFVGEIKAANKRSSESRISLTSNHPILPP